MGVLVLAVLLLVVMPALIYLIGWASKRYTEKRLDRIGFPVAPKRKSDTPGVELPARVAE